MHVNTTFRMKNTLRPASQWESSALMSMTNSQMAGIIFKSTTTVIRASNQFRETIHQKGTRNLHQKGEQIVQNNIKYLLLHKNAMEKDLRTDLFAGFACVLSKNFPDGPNWTIIFARSMEAKPWTCQYFWISLVWIMDNSTSVNESDTGETRNEWHVK